MLWTDVIEKYPFVITQTSNEIRVLKTGVGTAYKNRGKYYRDHQQMDKAFSDYDILVRTNSADQGDYSNMGNLFALKAKDAIQKALSHRPFNTKSESYLKFSANLNSKIDNFIKKHPKILF